MTISLFIICLKMSVKALTKLDLVSSYGFFYSAKIPYSLFAFFPLMIPVQNNRQDAPQKTGGVLRYVYD